MEIPLSFAHFQTNAVVQWSGRRKNGGKIDSNYCKIIFYLNLQFMKETLVEMNVQNRIVSIRISSLKKGLQEAVKPFLPALKEGLSKTGYTLSDVRFGNSSRMLCVPRSAGRRFPGKGLILGYEGSTKDIKEAVALQYSPDAHSAPVVKAKGKGDVARRIIEEAKKRMFRSSRTRILPHCSAGLTSTKRSRKNCMQLWPRCLP